MAQSSRSHAPMNGSLQHAMLDPWPTQVEVATSAVPLARHSVPLRRLPRGLATRENMEPQGDDLLADVDAWLRGLEASALFQAPASDSRSPCEAPAGDSQRLRPGRPRGKRTPRLSQLRVEPMNSTQRRKEELSFLRLKAAELERELAALGRRRIPADGRRGRESGEEARSAWRSIAKRQGAERARAERENARLLDKMQRHVRLRRAVERLLSECEEDAKEEMVDRWETPECHSRAELAKLRRLLQSVESHCPLLHVVLASNSSIGDGGYIKLNESVSGEISMEARYNQVVPFPYEVTGSVGWRGIQQGKLNFFPDVTVVDTTPDTAMVKMKAVLPSIVVTPATVYQAIKWLRDGDGEYVVWEMTASTDSSTDMPDGTLGSELREFAMLTAIKSSDRTTTHFACDQKGKLSECIAAAYHEMHLHAHQVLENLLLDATATV